MMTGLVDAKMQKKQLNSQHITRSKHQQPGASRYLNFPKELG